MALVTIVTPAFNAAAHLPDAIDSFLVQSFRDWEWVIVDDGSTDGTSQLVRRYEELDGRIRLVQPGRIGLVAALNHGCSLARGAYLARMDADDIAMPERLRRQIEFLQSRPEVVLAGSWGCAFGFGGTEVLKYPASSDTIACELLFHCPILHPTVMWRRAALVEKGIEYRDGFSGAEDYDLWGRCLQIGELANIPEVLLRYRRHQEQTTVRHHQSRTADANRVRVRQLHDFGIKFNSDELHVHYLLSTWQRHDSLGVLQKAGSWLLRLRHHNRLTLKFARRPFEDLLFRLWRYACFGSIHLGNRVPAVFLTSPLTGSIARRVVLGSQLVLKLAMTRSGKVER